MRQRRRDSISCRVWGGLVVSERLDQAQKLVDKIKNIQQELIGLFDKARQATPGHASRIGVWKSTSRS